MLWCCGGATTKFPRLQSINLGCSLARHIQSNPTAEYVIWHLKNDSLSPSTMKGPRII
jgi:hypothetical protein